MKHKTTYILILLSLLMFSCTENKTIEAEPQIVVEGWIDADDLASGKVFDIHGNIIDKIFF